ncbi:MAG: beta-galactosidase [Lachnospiraceae bacterium]|nr:beta-galactosidase [Lachnospiraceae bacterium]
MKAELNWLDNPEVFRVNQLPAHSDHEYYESEDACQSKTSRWKQSLNGTWKFSYSENAASRPKDFYQKDFDSSHFDEIQVPGHIELAGYDQIHYINTMYPWEGHTFRRPLGSGMKGVSEEEFSGAPYNPVGSYLCRFDLNEELKGRQVSIFFEGVEQAMYVWLNGAFIGYAEDSFTPSEFDITEHLCEKGNLLAVEVHKRSTAAYLEDQDFFRFFGIFRNVTLCARPNTHIEDLWVRPDYSVEDSTGVLNLDIRLSGILEHRNVQVLVKDKESVCICQNLKAGRQLHLSCPVAEKVKPWDHQNPYLYQLELRIFDENHSLVELVPCKFGFRKIEIQNKIILLNGKRLIINGVNRHEWSAQRGRNISLEEMRWDMECLKRNHINAVRTCHYPNQIPWYDLCDENGIYMMAETNLESHGSWQKMQNVEPSWNVPGSMNEWEAAVIDRAKTHFEVFKNHTSILFWSLGNESYAGNVLQKMNAYYKEQDPGRLVHYEGVFHNRDYEDVISDVESQMYAPPQRVEEYLLNSPKKPFILCEYMHSMGNSAGGLGTYMQLLDKYEMYQGGFIWDYIDQALFVTDEITGKQVLRYGGDFDDRPSDYEFSGNGIVFADRREKPAMQEVNYYYGLYS